MRKSQVFAFFLGLSMMGLAALLVHSAALVSSEESKTNARREWVARLGLSDLCLFTDARYARHPVMSDLHTPFQDHPRALEHFPSGTIIGVPPHLRAERIW